MSRRKPLDPNKPRTPREIAERVVEFAHVTESLSGPGDPKLALARAYLAAESAREQAEARAREAEALRDRLGERLVIAHQAECPTFNDATMRCGGCEHQDALDAWRAQVAARLGGATNG